MMEARREYEYYVFVSLDGSVQWDGGGSPVCGGGNRQSQSPGWPNSQLLSALIIGCSSGPNLLHLELEAGKRTPRLCLPGQSWAFLPSAPALCSFRLAYLWHCPIGVRSMIKQHHQGKKYLHVCTQGSSRRQLVIVEGEIRNSAIRPIWGRETEAHLSSSAPPCHHQPPFFSTVPSCRVFIAFWLLPLFHMGYVLPLARVGRRRTRYKMTLGCGATP